jgi:hypothetical protein
MQANQSESSECQAQDLEIYTPVLKSKVLPSPKSIKLHFQSVYTMLAQHKWDMSWRFEEALISQIIWFNQILPAINVGHITLSMSVLSICSWFILEVMFRFLCCFVLQHWYSKRSPSIRHKFLALFGEFQLSNLILYWITGYGSWTMKSKEKWTVEWFAVQPCTFLYRVAVAFPQGKNLYSHYSDITESRN